MIHRSRPSLGAANGAVGRWWQDHGRDVLWGLAIALGALVVARMVVGHSTLRLGVACAGMVLALGLASRAGPGLIYAVVVWTAVLGLVRRLLSSAAGPGKADPLLLIAVAAIVVLVVPATERGAFRSRSVLATAVLGLNILTILGAFNPLQHSLKAGLTGLVFMLVPVLAFWIGRGLGTDRTMAGVLGLLAGLGVLAAGYGLFQTYIGFPSWDNRWIQNSGYVALNVDNVIRAFSSFASAQEYALFLGVGLVVWVAFGLRLGRIVWTAGAVILLTIALFYESSRSALVTTVFAIGLMLAARFGRTVRGSIAVGLGVILLLPFAVGHLAPSSFHGATGTLAAHQVSGLVDPLNPSSSTLVGHFGLVTKGLGSAVHHPFGLGTSTVNNASKFGTVSKDTEFDPSNVAVALGAPGLLAYLVVVVAGFRTAVNVAQRRRDVLSVAALGIVAVTFLQWLNGGLYSVAYLPWLMLGWFDRVNRTDTQGLEDLPADGVRPGWS